MEPFEGATRKLASDSSPTISIVLPVITTLLISFEYRDADSSFQKKVKDNLRLSIQERFEELYQDKLVRTEINRKILHDAFLLDFIMYSVGSTLERFFVP